ncbi:MAG: glutamate racemase [Rhodospirillaceae bacterium]|nr:glutamate racemase [Rhodospirillaceae bacterium]
MNDTFTRQMIERERANSPRRQIAVFDSGIGGLGVVKEIRRLLPETDIVYVADNGGFPYGALPDEEVIDRCARIVEALERMVQPSAIVVACNTASTIALGALRARFPVPFIGCVPAIKWAARESKTTTFGLLATPATVRREYLRELIEQFAQGCTVITHGSQRLAPLAEQRFRGLPVDLDIMREEVEALTKAPGGEKLDTIVLGCTHYGFLLDELRAVSDAKIAWLDPAGAVARRVKAFLSALPPDPPRAMNLPANIAIFTAPLPAGDTIPTRLPDYGFPEFRVLDLVGRPPRRMVTATGETLPPAR